MASSAYCGSESGWSPGRAMAKEQTRGDSSIIRSIVDDLACRRPSVNDTKVVDCGMLVPSGQADRHHRIGAQRALGPPMYMHQLQVPCDAAPRTNRIVSLTIHRRTARDADAPLHAVGLDVTVSPAHQPMLDAFNGQPSPTGQDSPEVRTSSSPLSMRQYCSDRRDSRRLPSRSTPNPATESSSFATSGKSATPGTSYSRRSFETFRQMAEHRWREAIARME